MKLNKDDILQGIKIHFRKSFFYKHFYFKKHGKIIFYIGAPFFRNQNNPNNH